MADNLTPGVRQRAHARPAFAPETQNPLQNRRFFRGSLLLLLVALPIAAAKPDLPPPPRTTPPTIAAVKPKGAPQGRTTHLTIEGANIGDTTAIYFSQPGLSAHITGVKELPQPPENRLGSNGTASTIDLGPRPPRQELSVDLEISPAVPVGPINFRLKTGLGTTPTAMFIVEPPYLEVMTGHPAPIPAVLTGAIAKPGQTDVFTIHLDAPRELVVHNFAASAGSTLRQVISIDREDVSHPVFTHNFAAGDHTIRVSDFEQSGSANHFYRIAIAGLPESAALLPKSVRFPHTDTPITKSSASNTDQATAQTVAVPAAIEGALTAPAQYFRFHATAGQKLILDVNARRANSPLDSLIEVLDAQGRPVERATIRGIFETSMALRDHDSSLRGIRLSSFTGFKPGDFVLMGAEIGRIETLPPNPDSDYIFESANGERLGFFDTTPEAHALDAPVYRVQIAPPGTKFPPNGLPLIHLTYRNDDGGPGYGKDSRLHFTAPADADYLVRLQDVRGLTGPDYVYRLSLREPKPTYTVSFTPRNPNVPAGGRIPLTVTAMRFDDFDGPIEVAVTGLPPGLHATTGIILPGDTRTTLLLSADADARLEAAVPFAVNDVKDRLNLVSVVPRADVQMTAQTKEVTLRPGGTAEVAVAIQRNNGFAGRVPVEVRNLPPGVEVIDTGLNGVLINENETTRTFTLRLLPTAQPHTQPIYAAAAIETRAGGQQNSFATEAITLKIVQP